MANYTQSGYDPSLNGYWKGTIDGAPNFGYPKNYFFADTIRNVMIGFGNFFNEIKVIRYDKFGCPVKTLDVPLKFGPRNKSHDFRTEQETGKKYYISMPNLTYRIDSLEFDTERAKGIYEQRAFYQSDLDDAGLVCDMQTKFWSDVQPTPYNINISMEANCEKIADATQILEQIASRFNPACFMNLKEFWFFNKRRSIKIILNNTTMDIQSDSMGEEEWRQIKVSFGFKIEAVLYKPIKDAQIIEKINTYLTLNRGDYIYHGVTFGNANGSLDEQHDFSKIYQTKVGNAYVLDGNPVTTYDSATSAYTTLYNYVQTDQLTTYDKDAKLLKKVVTQWIPSSRSAEGPLIFHKRPIIGPDGKVEGYLPEIINVPDSAHPGETVTAYNSAVYSTTYTNEWMTTREYEYLSGYGKLDDSTVTFGTKVLHDQYDEPYDAYYSQYNEEGTYTVDPKDYKNGGADYLYKVIDDPRYGSVEFSGSKYDV